MGRRREEFELSAFEKWLTGHGAIVEAPTSEWEVIRFWTKAGLQVVYRNAKGFETWPAEATRLKDVFLSGQSEKLAPVMARKKRLRGKVADLLRRDGPECWFACGVVFEGSDDERATIEHLCARCYGGPNHGANLVLACEPCNRKADNLHIASKVAIREKNLAERGMLPALAESEAS